MSREVDIFVEAFATRVLPLFNELTLGAIHNFHPEDYPASACIAAAGALTASLLIYLLGAWLRRLPEKVSTPEQIERIERMRAPAAHWLPWLLILAPTPMGCVLILAAGFFRIRPRIAALAILTGEVLWRISPLLANH